ncbi:MAG: DUF533 domain-containing protein [Pseudomonadota bacterium]
MDAKGLLESILGSGRDALAKGRDVAEDKLGVPSEGTERDAMLSGMGKGAMAAGALALLLGTGAGRRLTGTALKLGGLAAVGGLAYKAFQNWKEGQSAPEAEALPGPPVGELTDERSEQRSLALLRAMMAAARADGVMDADERQTIQEQLKEMDVDAATAASVITDIDRAADPKWVAEGADSPAAAAEIYLVSLLVIDDVNPQERAYLQALADALGLSPALVNELEKQTRALT